MSLPVNTFKACAPQHDVQSVLSHIVPDALPKELYNRLSPVLFQNTGSTEFQELQRRLCRQQWRDVEFALRVKSAVLLGNRLAQQAVSADHFTIVNTVLPPSIREHPANHNQMIAKFIKSVRIPARLGRSRIRLGLQFFIKNTKPQFL